ncbi:hypothetical protein CC78DRAFT_581144 [Lojkania enalia]|uniref:Uncharacterized protein n=1 Tax=Lojkania enalia TaxID=147567 RepID=A0A9P4MZI7_9PLEO|nr:hypothetical protein CC78DRAFT_581144 [Didymosphaeria enalia]
MQQGGSGGTFTYGPSLHTHDSTYAVAPAYKDRACQTRGAVPGYGFPPNSLNTTRSIESHHRTTLPVHSHSAPSVLNRSPRFICMIARRTRLSSLLVLSSFRVACACPIAAMGVLSILPESFSALETWLTRLFLVLALIIIGPWAALLVYDLILYVFRSLTHEIPVIGGRARGRARPRAPSLTERLDGHRRKFSISSRRCNAPPQATAGVKPDASDPRFRHIKEEDDGNPLSI